MADKASKEEAAGEPDADPAPKKKGKLIVMLALVLLPAGAAGGTYAMMSGGGHGKAPPKPVIGPVIALDSFVVNLADPNRTRYLKLTVDLELDGALKEDEGKKLLPRYRDQVLMYLMGLTSSDLQKPEAKVTIKKKLLDFAATTYGKRGVRAVYYKEFVTQ